MESSSVAVATPGVPPRHDRASRCRPLSETGRPQVLNPQRGAGPGLLWSQQQPPPVVVPLYQLTWDDTSTTESGFALYQSQAGGPFVVLGAYGPNTTSSPPLPVSGRAASG
jgi:hypothetical protein